MHSVIVVLHNGLKQMRVMCHNRVIRHHVTSRLRLQVGYWCLHPHLDVYKRQVEKSPFKRVKQSIEELWDEFDSNFKIKEWDGKPFEHPPTCLL